VVTYATLLQHPPHRLLPPLRSPFRVTPTTQTYTLSLHDALPISSSANCSPHAPTSSSCSCRSGGSDAASGCTCCCPASASRAARSEEHTSELQSRFDLVCRLLLEKKNSQRRTRDSSVKENTRKHE